MGSAAADSLELQGENFCFLKVPNCLLTQLIALLNLSALGFSLVVFHDKAKRTEQGNLLLLTPLPETGTPGHFCARRLAFYKGAANHSGKRLQPLQQLKQAVDSFDS